MKTTAVLTFLTLASAGWSQQPAFEIADVHVSTTSRFAVQSFGGSVRAGRYINRDATLLALIAAAYGVSEDSIAGGPGWISNDLFDVVAKVPEGTTPATANLMLRSLLAERFGLVVHNGIGPVPRFVLTVAKNGPKLKPADPSGTPGCQPKQGPPGGPDPASQPNARAACHNLTAAAIAQNLRQMAGAYLDHDLIDETKLEGSYDFDIEWTARAFLAAKGSDGISIFDAVEKQLGLKLEAKTVELPSFTVEKVNRKPTANPAGAGTALALAAARFEAATIKPANPDRPFMGLLYMGGSQIHGGGTLRDLIGMSLQVTSNVGNDLVIGIPKSAESQKWDIMAKVPTAGEGAPVMIKGQLMPPPLSVALEMVRGLLIENFELRTHTETREVTVYALTLAGRVPKMIRAEEAERAGCNPDPNAPKPTNNIQFMFACKNTSMAELADLLQNRAAAYMDHPVVDGTGLEGGWNFLVGWTPKALIQTQPQVSGQASDPDGITAFEAVERELGLKLVKQKRSIPVIVVDHVDDQPLQ